MSWVKVGRLETLTFAPGAAVVVGDREFAVFPTPGGSSPYRAVVNSCPHAGASLHDGDLEGCVIACLWHGWRFDLETGESLVTGEGLATYPGRVSDGELELDL